MNIPKAKFTVGDAVMVKQVEAGSEPFCPGIVTGVRIDWNGQLDYCVNIDGGNFDGYTEDWLHASPHK